MHRRRGEVTEEIVKSPAGARRANVLRLSLRGGVDFGEAEALFGGVSFDFLCPIRAPASLGPRAGNREWGEEAENR